jgi:NAD+ synthase
VLSSVRPRRDNGFPLGGEIMAATVADEIASVVAWIRDRVKEADARGCVVGLSGGVDSSVVGALCKRAFPESSLGVIMPYFSKDDDFTERARAFAQALGMPTLLHPIGEAHERLAETFLSWPDVAKLEPGSLEIPLGNLRSRLRMCTLYLYANAMNYIVVGTGNKDEDHGIGYFTKYGDGGVDISPIADFHKSEVYQLARALGVPPDILEAPPSAGLWDGQTDEDELGMTYDEIAFASDQLDSGQPAADSFTARQREVVEKVAEMRSKNRHKLHPPLAYLRQPAGDTPSPTGT